MRLNKFLSQAGVASRRTADTLIAGGAVKINGEIVTKLGVVIDEKKDKVEVNKEVVEIKEKKVYLKLNKPEGFVCSLKPQNHRSVVELVPIKEKLMIVGRLDLESTGLVIMTNDGELTQILTHPKYNQRKGYVVKVRGNTAKNSVLKLVTGVRLKEGMARLDSLETLEKNIFKVYLHQGWNRQVRRMFAAVDLEVVELHRIEHGPISLEQLKEGKFKYIEGDELLSLKKLKMKFEKIV